MRGSAAPLQRYQRELEERVTQRVWKAFLHRGVNFLQWISLSLAMANLRSTSPVSVSIESFRVFAETHSNELLNSEAERRTNSENYFGLALAF